MEEDVGIGFSLGDRNVNGKKIQHNCKLGQS